jgi:hypothetical protein
MIENVKDLLIKNKFKRNNDEHRTACVIIFIVAFCIIAEKIAKPTYHKYLPYGNS